MTTHLRRSRRSTLLTCGLLLVLLAVPVVLTYRAWRQEQVNQALIAAINANEFAVALDCLKQGADANARDEPKETGTFWKYLRHHFQHRSPPPKAAPTALLVLLEPCDLKPEEAEAPIGINYRPECVPLVKALLERGADVNAYDGSSALEQAVVQGKMTSFHLLLEHGADVNRKGNAGQTLLMWAALCGYTDILKLLHAKGADVNARDVGGWTALIWAVVHNQPDSVQLLLDWHVDTHVRTDDGKTALEIAREGKHIPIIRLLQHAGATE